MLSFSFYIPIAQKALGQEIWSHLVRTSAQIPQGLLSWLLKGFPYILTWQLGKGQLSVLGSHFPQSFFWDGTTVARRWVSPVWDSPASGKSQVRKVMWQVLGSTTAATSWGPQELQVLCKFAPLTGIPRGLRSQAYPCALPKSETCFGEERTYLRGSKWTNHICFPQPHTTLSSCGCLNIQCSMTGKCWSSHQNCLEHGNGWWAALCSHIG